MRKKFRRDSGAFRHSQRFGAGPGGAGGEAVLFVSPEAVLTARHLLLRNGLREKIRVHREFTQGFYMQEKQFPSSKRSLKEYLRILSCCFIMGAADVVPGVSGGTMAFILGIYDELIESIRRFTGKECFSMLFRFQLRRAVQTLPWPFLATLGLGILAAIALFSTPIRWMLEHRLALILAFFFGLVLASAVAVLPRVKRWSAGRFVALIAGTAAGWLIVGLPLLQNPPDSPFYLILCGAVAICAMILPGISGSFILLLMGKYHEVLNAVHELKSGVNFGENLLTLALFVLGIVLGISWFIRLLGYLLRRFHDLTIAVLIGFMLGSLRKVWPWKLGDSIENENILPSAFDNTFFLALLLGAAGFALVLLIERFAGRKEEAASTAGMPSE